MFGQFVTPGSLSGRPEEERDVVGVLQTTTPRDPSALGLIANWIALYFVFMNGALNLLPLPFLDGGRLVRVTFRRVFW